MDHPALFYKKLPGDKVQCLLCPHHCIIDLDQKGICQVRINLGGELFSSSYGKISSAAVDPVEKKPLYHFFPGEKILSFGTIGCNFKCPYCQNWQISQHTDIPVEFLSPQEAVELAQDKKMDLIAYTYSEPIVWYEWVRETAQLARKQKIKNVMVTNGYIEQEPLMELYPVIDAMNIDVKAFNEKFYQQLCHGRLEKVKETVRFLADKIHLELTMLVIPDWNDNEEEISQFADWVSRINPLIPVHFSRYYPQYKFDQEATSIQVLEKIYEIAKQKLPYVYIGNARIPGSDNTYCPQCKNILIERKGYHISLRGLKTGECSSCRRPADIILS